MDCPSIRLSHRCRRRLAGLALAVLIVAPIACGEHDVSQSGPSPQGGSTPEEILEKALGDIGRFEPVELDTAAIAAAVQSGQSIRLPFAQQDGAVVLRDVNLTLRNLRAPELDGFVLKDGVKNEGQTVPLPPPATYQGVVAATDAGHRGAAVFTITQQVVEGNMLVAPGGWSIIEPIEPMLRLRGVDPAQRQTVLRKYNHIVYNVGYPLATAAAPPAMAAARPSAPGDAAAPLVLSIVGDGDQEFFRAYPTDSVMPFWLKEEGIFNALDWLYNCIEPDANAYNDYTECGNAFDGGSGAFQAQLRIDRLEVWTAGGPQSPRRAGVMEESARMTHQATPVCCGEPHTAGRSNLVHFFSGKAFPEGAGVASIAGLNLYTDACFAQDAAFCCHHAVSTMTPNPAFPASLFHQQLLVAHEVGHNNGADDELTPKPHGWLYGTQFGDTLMYSSLGFTPRHIFVYSDTDAVNVIGPLLRARLGDTAGTAAPCSAEVIGPNMS